MRVLIPLITRASSGFPDMAAMTHPLEFFPDVPLDRVNYKEAND
ncbi:hypothetical protein [Rhizobium lusitanum]|jgi:hypothetical protein|nr:hypothetical protein [Rhizobium lusitanum]